jgi:hypothetical protein
MFMLQSPLDYFITSLKAIRDVTGAVLYTGIEAIEIDSSIWVDSSRPRIVTVSIIAVRDLFVRAHRKRFKLYEAFW